MPTNRSPSSTLSAGQRLGGCRVERFLGHGGMGEVYLAEHERLKKPVALKVLRPGLAGADGVARFLKEARSGSRIEHANVVTIHDVGQAGDLHYIVMQYVEGRNLAELLEIEHGPLPWQAALRVIKLAAGGVHAVHRHGLIHRDIKPSNIMLSADSRVLLMDFGLVREEAEPGVTQAGRIVGTPMFMSPEQCRGQRLDARSDIFSLGGTLYCLLTARPPFAGGADEVVNQIASGKRPPPVHEVNPQVPREVSDLVARAMQFRPADRFADAAAMAKVIGALLRKTQLASTTSWEGPEAGGAVHDAQRIPELILLDEESERPWYGRSGVAVFAGGGLVGLALLIALAVWIAGGPSGKPGLTGMVRIEAGHARLGCREELARAYFEQFPAVVANQSEFDLGLAIQAEEPQRRVYVPAFWIDVHEVTNDEYAKFVRATGRQPPKGFSGAVPPAERGDHPVTHVTIADAEAYAAWAGKKLPTREQWLRAYRGDDERLLPWGDEFQEARVNTMENKNVNPPATTSVGGTPQDVSPFQVYNLVGNASELIRERAVRNSRNGAVIKGSDYGTDGKAHGTAPAQTFLPDGKSDQRVGFRCVVEIP